MIKLGLDFDNTLTNYDYLFFKLALEKNLIPQDLEKNKLAVRKYLIDKNIEKQFTLLQGEVYGRRIEEACQTEGMFDALKNIKKRGIKIFIVSHKSKYPFLGPKYDLHKSALKWMEKNNFFSPEGLGLTKNDIFFEQTKESKIERIKSLGCSHFIDDLPEILKMIDSKITKIFYNPFKLNIDDQTLKNLFSWNDLQQIII